MKTAAIVLGSALLGAICALLLWQTAAGREGPRQHYQLKSVDETTRDGNHTVKSLYRMETTTGHTWHLESSPVWTGSHDTAGQDIVVWADGWQEIPESTELAIAAERKRIAAAARLPK